MRLLLRWLAVARPAINGSENKPDHKFIILLYPDIQEGQNIMITRRSVIRSLTATTAFAAFPLPSLATGEKVYDLIAAPAEFSLAGPEEVPTRLWLYNGTSPGPLIRAHKGDILKVNFTNRLDQPTTVHWHGIRNINAMDGVPDLTQPAVEPGETFTYRFPLPDAGTFWYHAHNKSWEQVARGLYGPLIVGETGETAAADNPHDILLVADDWRLDDAYQLDEQSFGSLMDWSHQGRLGNWLTINGESRPQIELPRGLARIRLINTANARTLSFRFGDGLPVDVIALDGAACTPFRADTIRLAPAQRVDLLVDGGRDIDGLYEVSSSRPFAAAWFTRGEGKSAQASSLRPDPAPLYPMPDIEGARIIPVHMQGGAMGNLESAEFQGEVMPLRELAREHSKLWAFNGVVGGYHHVLADISLGERVVLRVRNDSRWEHAMHLHGHHFWVRSREFGDEERAVLRDTYLMAPGEEADLVFIADNPGMWLFHCHMLEHHAAGMGAVLNIS